MNNNNHLKRASFIISCMFLSIIFFEIILPPGACSEQAKIAQGSKKTKVMELVAHVDSIHMVEPDDISVLKPWCVVYTITSVPSQSNNEISIKIGEQYYMYIHSVYKTFKGLEEDVLGKNFRFYFFDEFSQNYTGKIKVKPIE